MELGLFADRQFDGGDSCTESVSELGQRPIERSTLFVELVDEDHPRHAVILGNTPRILRLDLNTLNRRDNEDGEVGNTHGCVYVADEVGVPGCVDQVDLEALPLEGCESERQRHAPGVLFWVEVGDRGALFNRSEALDRAARKRSASASVVLPAPECPTSATLRILSGGNTFTARASMFVVERRSDATQTWAPRVWPGGGGRLRSHTARVAKLVDAAVLNTAVLSGAWGFESLPGHQSAGRTGETEDGGLALGELLVGDCPDIVGVDESGEFFNRRSCSGLIFAAGRGRRTREDGAPRT